MQIYIFYFEIANICAFIPKISSTIRVDNPTRKQGKTDSDAWKSSAIADGRTSTVDVRTSIVDVRTFIGDGGSFPRDPVRKFIRGSKLFPIYILGNSLK